MIAEAIKDTGIDVGEFNIYTQYLKSVQQIVGKANTLQVLEKVDELQDIKGKL